ncbi:MAG: L-aspartate oxidase [Clostridia bacterium]
MESRSEIIDTDVLVMGSGIAGVYTALCIQPDIEVTVIAKEEINISNSALAQGGIAVSLGEEDSPRFHLEDTMQAGAGLCSEDRVWILVNEARENIMHLCDLGVNFDMHMGNLSLTREAAHSQRRIIHAGDFTGKEVCDKLIYSAEQRPNIIFKEKIFAIDILTSGKEIRGLLVLDQKTGRTYIYRCKWLVCASGGFGQLYENTTNPIVATGDGMAMAYRAGCTLTDMEFVQFHPTVLHHANDKTFLISEAVRGEGAVLRNKHGKQFMSGYHEQGELAPRDIVARAIFSEMGKTDADCVYLDITFRDREYLMNRFPKIFATCLNYGIDISKDQIPVAPAEHYCMGGIITDINGRTEITDFYACGEVAGTNIHGANRLASNSLLEGLVFGRRIAEDINGNRTYKTIGKLPAMKKEKSRENLSKPVIEIEKEIKKTMNRNVGIIRSRESLEEAETGIDAILGEFKAFRCSSMAQMQVLNMATVAKTVIVSAIKREESRGAHYRTDFPDTDEKWQRNTMNKRREISDDEFEFDD